MHSRVAGRSAWRTRVAGILIVALVGVLGPIAAPAQSSPDEVVAAVPSDFPPEYGVDAAGGPDGFAIDVMDAVARRAGLTVRYRVLPTWAQVDAAFRAGQADLVPNEGITPKRERYGKFTRPIETVPVSIFVRRHTTAIHGATDLAGRVVATVATNAAEVVLAAASGVTVKHYPSLSAALSALLSDEVGALAYPEPAVWRYARQAGLEQRIEVAGAPLLEVKRAIFVRPDRPALVAKLDTALADLVASPEFEAIYRKWYAKPPPYWTRTRGLRMAGALLVVLVVAAGLWRHLLVVRFNRRLLGLNRKLAQAETEARASETRFETLARSAPVGIFRADEAGRCLYVNRRWCELTGLAAEVCLGESWTLALHPDDRDRAAARWAGATSEPFEFAEELRLRRPDGSDVWVVASVVAEEAVEGTPACRVGTLTDITEREQTEHTLRRLNRARETIARCNAAVVRITDEDRLLQAMCEILAESGGFALAWAGYAGDDPDRTVRPAAKAGPAVGYLDETVMRWGDDAYGRGPAGTAIRTRATQVVTDFPDTAAFDPWREAAARWSLRSVVSLPLVIGDRAFGVLCVYSGDAEAFDAEEVKILEELASDLSFGISTIRTRSERDAAQGALHETLLQMIGAIALTVEKRDPYTAGHQARVAELAVAIGHELGWDADRVEGLRLGSLVHDIGKIYIPAEILNRPGRLSEYEYALIKTHSQVGYEILSGVRFPWPVQTMILQHHERMDGSGYPNGLRGDQIIEEARILAVADVVEAMTAHRPYRPALGVEVGLREIERGRGTLYDPTVVDACLRVFRERAFRWESRAITTPAQ